MNTDDTKLAVELAEIKAAVNGVLKRVDEIADRQGSQITDHEARIRVIERVHDQVNPLESRKDLDDIKNLLSRVENERHTIGAIVRNTGGVVGWLAGLAIALIAIVDAVSKHN